MKQMMDKNYLYSLKIKIHKIYHRYFESMLNLFHLIILKIKPSSRNFGGGMIFPLFRAVGECIYAMFDTLEGFETV